MLMRLALFCTVSTLAMGSAFAQDATEFATAIEKAYGLVGYTVDFGTGSGQDGTLTYDAVTVSIPSAGSESFTIAGPITFTGVEEFDDGSYSADGVSIPTLDFTVEAVKVTIADISAESLYVPAADGATALDASQMIGTLSTGALSVSMAGTPVVSATSISYTNTFVPEQGSDALTAINTEAGLEGLEINLDSVTDPQAKAFIAALGVSKITGSASETVQWTLADGRLNLEDMSVVFDNLGTISIAADLSGYTAEVITAMAEGQAAAAAATTPEARTAAETALGEQMLEKLTITSASFRYEDASLTGTLLDFFAKQQNLTRENLVMTIKAVTPAMLAQMGNPTLATQISTAVGTFLENPQNFTVSVAPAQPLTFKEISAAGTANPAGLVDTLGLTISANTDE